MTNAVTGGGFYIDCDDVVTDDCIEIIMAHVEQLLTRSVNATA